MPPGWEQSKRTHPFQHLYPDDDEILKLGTPVSWESMMKQSGLASFKEVAIALSDAWLHKKFTKPHLAKKLHSSLPPDMYYPMEDILSVFLMEDIMSVLASKGAKSFYYSDPIEERQVKMLISPIKPVEAAGLALCEILITDEHHQFAFMSEYDAYTTLILSKKDHVRSLIQKYGWEAVICDHETTPAWFLD